MGFWDKAEIKYRSADSIYQILNDEAGVMRISGNRAILSAERGNFVEAIAYFKKMADYYLQNGNTLMMLSTYLNVSKCYAHLGDIKQSKQYLDLARAQMDKQSYPKEFQLAYTINEGVYLLMSADYTAALENFRKVLAQTEQTALREEALKALVECYKKLGQNTLALSASEELGLLKDTLLQTAKRDLLEESDQIITVADHLLELEKVKYEKLSLIYRFTALLFLLIIAFAITIKIVTQQRKRIRLSKIENEKLAHKLELKNKELTNMAVEILERSRMTKDLITQIKKYDRGQDTQMSHIMKGNRLLTDEKQELEVYLDEKFAKVIDSLQEHYPDLNVTDKKLISLLIMNLSSKDIASILDISSRSVDNARSKLRQKLQIPKNANVSDFLLSFIKK